MENNELLILPLSELGRPNTEMEFFFFDSELLDGVGKPTLTSIANDGTVRRYSAGGGGGETLAETLDLGNLANVTGTILTSSGLPSLDINNRILRYSSGVLSVDWEQGLINDTSNIRSIHYLDRQAIDSNSTASIDWENRSLRESVVGVPTLDWNSKYLIASFGNSADWENCQMNDASALSLDWANRILFDNTGAFSILWNSRTLAGTFGVTVAWENMQLYDAFGNLTVDWNGLVMNDNGISPSLDWGQRKLIGSTAIDIINYSDADGDGHLVLSAPTTVNNPSNLSNSQMTYRVNEGSNQLEITVKYADGLTVKTGYIDLL